MVIRKGVAYMDIWIAIILGIVEGLTEFIPVSSTGHMILVSHLLDVHTEPRIHSFEVVVQLGAILAITTIFWGRIRPMIFSRHINIFNSDFHHRFNWLHILLGMIPAGLIGVFLSHQIKDILFNNPISTVLAIVVGGCLLVIADIFRPRGAVANTLDEITYKQAFIVGIFQVCALWPGFSRSGSTISGGVLSGMSYKVATQYTFILALPMMVGASGKSIIDNWSLLTMGDLPFFAVGLIAAFVTSLLVIKFFINLIARIKLTPFAIYRFIIAIIFLFVIYR